MDRGCGGRAYTVVIGVRMAAGLYNLTVGNPSGNSRS